MQWDKKAELHAKAKEDLVRLFPNHAVDIGPADVEPEPDSTVTDNTGDDFDADDRDSTINNMHNQFLQIATEVANPDPNMPTVQGFFVQG